MIAKHILVPTDFSEYAERIRNSKAIFACLPRSCQSGSPSGFASGRRRGAAIRPARRPRIACKRDRGHGVSSSGRTSPWVEARPPRHPEAIRQRSRRTGLAPSGRVKGAGGPPPV